MAQILLCKQTQDSIVFIGINWVYNFIKHHPALCTQYNQHISYQHAKQEDPNVIRQWFETIQEAIQEHDIHKNDIWNFNKTGFAIGLCSTSKIITAVECSKRPQRVIQGNCKWITIIECV